MGGKGLASGFGNPRDGRLSDLRYRAKTGADFVTGPAHDPASYWITMDKVTGVGGEPLGASWRVLRELGEANALVALVAESRYCEVDFAASRDVAFSHVSWDRIG